MRLRIFNLSFPLSYKQQKFNLFREENEGYAKLVTELNQAGPLTVLYVKSSLLLFLRRLRIIPHSDTVLLIPRVPLLHLVIVCFCSGCIMTMDSSLNSQQILIARMAWPSPLELPTPQQLG